MSVGRGAVRTLVGLAIVAGLSIVVGFASEGWEGFNWEVAALVGTAIGTTALALATSTDVRATQELAAVAREELAVAKLQADASQAAAEAAQASAGASTTPLLTNARGTASPVQVGLSERELILHVPFRNVGAGVAIIQAVGLRVSDIELEWSGGAEHPVIPPRESSRASFAVRRTEPTSRDLVEKLLRGGNFSAELTYTNAGGTQTFMTRLDIYESNRPADVYAVSSQEWRVSQVHLCDPATRTAYVSSSPALSDGRVVDCATTPSPATARAVQREGRQGR